MKPVQINIFTGLQMVRTIPGSPKLLTVVDDDCEKNFLLRIKAHGEDHPKILHKNTLLKFYRPATIGEQAELFDKPITVMDRLKSKHLKDGRG